MLPADARDYVAGDLLEMYAGRIRSRGRLRAGLWYWGQALSFSGLFLRERVRDRRASPGADASGVESARRLGPPLFGGPVGRRGYWRWKVVRMLESWMRDLAQATRSLLRAPAFTAVVVATLALAIGSNTAIFSVIEAVLIDPLAFSDADRLVTIRASAPGSDLPAEFGVAPEFWVQYKENASDLEDVGMFQQVQSTIRFEGQVEHPFMAVVTPSLFTTLGSSPVIGRLPTEEDDDNVVVMSYAFWTTWFGRDPGVLGKTYDVAGAQRTVIGVMGPDFRFPIDKTAFWIRGKLGDRITPGRFGYGLIGRMTPGMDATTLATQLNELARRLPERFGGSAAYARIIEQHRAVVRSLEEDLVGAVERPLWVLLGTVGIVLLIACANVANLLIVRAESRRRDLAVRRALGAGRLGLVRSQMSEALILALLGGVGGALLTWVGVPLLVHAAPESIPRLDTVRLDRTALLFAAGVSMLAALLAGLLPAIRFSNPRLSAFRLAGRIGSGPDHVTRDALVVVQTAAALVLLVGSGLLVQSFRALSHVDPGFDTADIFSFQMAPTIPEFGGTDGPAIARFQYAFMDRLKALPGVESVGLVNSLPLDEGAGTTRFASERTEVMNGEAPLLRFTYAGGDYFQTMGIRLLGGRYFERLDRATGEVGVIVSRAAADVLWPGEDAVGKLVKSAADSAKWMTVIGVVEDVMLKDFRQAAPDPMVYLPLIGSTPTSWRVGGPAYVVKTARAETIAPEIRGIIREVAPDAPMYRIFTMAGLAARSYAQLSFTMLTLGIAAALALVLGAVGLYGVLSYVVSQRTRELGIRMALGAEARELQRMVVAQGSRVALVGVAIGVVAALWLTRALGSLLFGVRAVDATTFVTMSVLMLAVALLASFIPARRASAVDPMCSLRAD